MFFGNVEKVEITTDKNVVNTLLGSVRSFV